MDPQECCFTVVHCISTCPPFFEPFERQWQAKITRFSASLVCWKKEKWPKYKQTTISLTSWQQRTRRKMTTTTKIVPNTHETDWNCVEEVRVIWETIGIGHNIIEENYLSILDNLDIPWRELSNVSKENGEKEKNNKIYRSALIYWNKLLIRLKVLHVCGWSFKRCLVPLPIPPCEHT